MSHQIPLDRALLTAADTRIRQAPELSHAESLLVLHQDEVVFESYYRGRTAEDLADTHSVTKSVTAALVGVLVHDGALSLEAPVLSLLGLGSAEDPARNSMTVRHLLTMTSGLSTGERWDLCTLALHGQPWIETTLVAPLDSEPGRCFAYNNGAAHVLSAVVAQVSGSSVAEFAAERLFGPLGIDRYSWPSDPQGYHCGCGHLALKPRDLLKLGSLFLQGGRWQDTRVLGEDYVAAATGRQSAGGPPEGTGYGFLWWVDDLASSRAFFAGGFGGQYVYVVPALDLVVVTTADAYSEPPRWGRTLRHLIEAYVVPAALRSMR